MYLVANLTPAWVSATANCVAAITGLVLAIGHIKKSVFNKSVTIRPTDDRNRPLAGSLAPALVAPAMPNMAERVVHEARSVAFTKALLAKYGLDASSEGGSMADRIRHGYA
jgi:hypothetical protein